MCPFEYKPKVAKNEKACCKPKSREAPFPQGYVLIEDYFAATENSAGHEDHKKDLRKSENYFHLSSRTIVFAI